MFIQSITYYFLLAIIFAFSVVLKIIITISDLKTWVEEDEIEKSYDYVIVGGGSAGAILAARLSENPKVSVLLLEAGGNGADILNIPALGPLKQTTDLDWKRKTVPQTHSCFGLENNVSKWPSGKLLGGSTHLNYMIYIKGHKNDYLTWKHSDSSHWDFEDISYYFQKAEKFVCSYKDDNCERDTAGSILVRKNIPYTTELSEAILKAANELGYNLSDLNINSSTGFMKPHLNLNKFGKRWTSDQYLNLVKKKRKNLKVLTNAVGEKILFKDGFEAYGVKYQKRGESDTVLAKREVIVAAGTVGSAKLLMLSGIGPEKDLINAKIPLKIDLPVGKNLQDHVTTGLDLIILRESLFSFIDLMLPSSAYQYFVHGTGPFTSGMVEAVGVVHSTLVDPLKDSPDLEFMILLAGVSSDKGIFFRNSMGISEKVWQEYFQFLTNETVVSIIPVLLHPKSVGEITLDPTNPEGEPKIDPKYLSREEDVKTLVEGIRIVWRMTETSAMKNLGAKFYEKKFPGCELLDFDSDEYWECYVRHLTLTVYHPVGTCKMGKLEDGGVVDHRLRVHSTNKLRVIDASVMPTLPSANTNAAVVMIAEKGADLIKEDFHTRFSSCHQLEILLSSNIFNDLLRSKLSTEP